MRDRTLGRRAVGEALGTALLVGAVVGSGIMGEDLAAGNVALALLANSIATGAALVALILTFAPVSGAHLNPAVTLAMAVEGQCQWRDVPAYVCAQILGGILGVGTANMMFDLPIFAWSNRVRAGQLTSEIIATFGLLTILRGCSRSGYRVTAVAVAAYITSAYWFTASTSFANPAVTLARSLTDTFAGIRPLDVPGFVVAQLFGAAAATLLFRWLLGEPSREAEPAPAVTAAPSRERKSWTS